VILVSAPACRTIPMAASLLLLFLLSSIGGPSCAQSCGYVIGDRHVRRCVEARRHKREAATCSEEIRPGNPAINGSLSGRRRLAMQNQRVKRRQHMDQGGSRVRSRFLPSVRNRTPGLSPFVNSTPAPSSACLITLSVDRRGSPLPASNRRTVATPTPAASASCC
jgi:hypothetical protein